MAAPDSHRVLSYPMVLRNRLSGFFISRTSLSLSMEDHSGSFRYEKSHQISSALQPSRATRDLPFFIYYLPFRKNRQWSIVNDKSCAAHKFRLFRFRSPLLTESHMISFPGVTKMFQFTPCPAKSYINPCGYIFTFG